MGWADDFGGERAKVHRRGAYIYIYILILLKICLIYIFFHKPRGAGALWDPPESVPV